MFNDSDSPQSDYNSLLNWLSLPQTEAALALLKVEADNLNQVVVRLPPPRDLGGLMGHLLHREQAVGEIRGLERLQALLDDRKRELQIKLKIIEIPTQDLGIETNDLP